MAMPDSGMSVRERAVVCASAFLSFLALTALLLWLQGDSGSSTQGKKFTHMHCPECMLEMAYLAEKEGIHCPQCGGSGPKLVATVGPYKDRHLHQVSMTGKISAAVVVSLVVVLGLSYGWVLYSRVRRRAAEEALNQPLICHCPFCSRKIGYPPRKIGTGIVCPRCKTAFALPEGAVLEKAE